VSALPQTRRDARHNAKFSAPILSAIIHELPTRGLILDPMGGVGTLAREWGRHVITGELEWEWVKQAPRPCVQQDVHALPYRNGSIACVVTSPTYGNRMADHHNARDTSKRNGYAFWLREVGVEPHPNNSGVLGFNKAYKLFHLYAYREIRRVLEPNGLFLLNISNFIKRKREVDAVKWHAMACHALGFKEVGRQYIETPRLRFGENHDARVEHEVLLVMSRG